MSQGIIRTAGHPAAPEDIGDVFAKAAALVRYADRALSAETAGDPRPPPPNLLADELASRVFFAVAGLSTVLLLVPVVAASRQSPRALLGHLGLTTFRPAWVWQAFLWTLLAYSLVLAYSEAAKVTGIDVLVPDQPTPRAALRDPLTMALFGFLAVGAAPMGEESLFRGLVFGGLARWGFWPGALASGFAFALSHADTGTLIPFTLVGTLFAFLFWHTRSLWPSIICHAYFNGVSLLFLLLAAS